MKMMQKSDSAHNACLYARRRLGGLYDFIRAPNISFYASSHMTHFHIINARVYTFMQEHTRAIYYNAHDISRGMAFRFDKSITMRAGAPKCHIYRHFIAMREEDFIIFSSRGAAISGAYSGAGNNTS